MKNLVNEFKAFLMKGNLVDLAIAVVLATSFGALVKAFTDKIVMGIIGLVVGNPNFDQKTWVISRNDADEVTRQLQYGPVLTAAVSFFFVGLACFMIIKAYNKMTSLRGAGSDEEAAAPTDVELLAEIRDLLKSQAK